MSALVEVTAPGVEPVTTAKAKAHLRIDDAFTDEDDYIDGLVKTARIHAENVLGRSLITTTWDYFLDAWPAGDTIVLPRPRLQSVTSVKYTDEDGVQSTFAASNYYVDIKSEPGRIVLASDAVWPSDTLRAANGVEVRFVSGYGAGASSVPQNLLHALKLHVASLYEGRGDVEEGEHRTYNALLLPERIWSFL